jgi:hypothetical protein
MTSDRLRERFFASVSLQASRDFWTDRRTPMRSKLIATLIICVSFLTQIGASLSGAAAARDGFGGRLWCHNQIVSQIGAAKAAVANEATTPRDAPAPKGAPVSHDHGSCSFCQAGMDAPTIGAAVIAPRHVKLTWRAALAEAEAPVFRSALNRGAPARAPPSLA